MTTEITIRQWVKRGVFLVNADALDHDDPDHVYNQIKAQGVDPEDFGYHHPLHERFKDMSRSALIDRIIELEREISAARMFM